MTPPPRGPVERGGDGAEELRRRLERLQAVVDAGIDAMISLDPDGGITLFNRAATRLFGHAADDVLGQPFIELFTEKVRENVDIFVASHLGTASKRMVIGHVLETRALTRDGGTVPVELTISLGGADSPEPFLLAIVRDISDRKRSERILRETEAQLVLSQKMEAVGLLAGGVAHDFNNLLGAIIGYSDMLLLTLGRAGELDRQRLEGDVGEISRAAKRAAELTKQLLAFSRRQVLQPRVIDPNEIVRSAQRMLGRVIGEDVTLRTELADDLARVKADPGQLEQVITNLAVNSRDAMPDGGELTIATRNADGPFVEISVADTGHGMDEDTVARAFEPFFTTKGIGKGTGLGLSTVYGIVKQSGGKIRIDSTPGEGTIFHVLLPPVDTLEQLPPMGEAEEAPTGGDETILLVEDEETLRTLVSRMLMLNGYRLLTAVNGEDALRVAREHGAQVDLLLTDIVMPRMDGNELARRMVERYPRVAVVYMSGYTDVTAYIPDREPVAVDSLQKPFSAAALATVVRRLLDSRGR